MQWSSEFATTIHQLMSNLLLQEEDKCMPTTATSTTCQRMTQLSKKAKKKSRISASSKVAVRSLSPSLFRDRKTLSNSLCLITASWELEANWFPFTCLQLVQQQNQIAFTLETASSFALFTCSSLSEIN